MSVSVLAALFAVSCTAAGADTTSNAISWAQSHLGQDFDDGYCLLFVAQAYSSAGVDIGSSASALSYWQQNPKGYTEHAGDTSPPVGALVFWGATSANPYGHVGIYLGGDQVISTSSWPSSAPDVHTWSFSGRNAAGYPYLGWLSPVTSQPAGNVVSVTNADDGVYWRAQPDYNTPIQQAGWGVYTGDQVALNCWQEGASNTPPYYNNPLWYQATVVSGRGTGSGWVNDHFLVTGSNVPNQPVPGVPTCQPPIDPPGAPNSVSATAGDGQVTVTWSAPDSDGGSAITDYTVTSSPDGAGCSTAGSSCVVEGLTDGQSYTFAVSAANAAGQGPAAVSAAVVPGVAPAITSDAVATFTTADRGAYMINVSGAPLASVSETGALPRGLLFTDNGDGTASLAGRPTIGSAGIYPIVITAINGVGAAAVQQFTLTVLGLHVTNPTLPNATHGVAYRTRLKADGGTAPYAWSEVGGSLPRGLVLNSDGTIVGRPAKGTAGRTFSFSVLLQDSTTRNRQAVIAVLSLVVS